MGIVSPKTTADRYLHALTGCIPDLEGDVTLEPSNHFLNWRFDDLDDDSNPDGLEIGRPEDPEGFMVYVSDKIEDPGPSELTSQTLEPIDLDEDTYHIIANPVEGAAPRSSQFAAQIAPPEAPTLSVVPASLQGWAAGTYRVSYTWIDGDKHTALAPITTVTLGLGQFMRVFLPTSPPDGATHIGIWVSSPNGSIATLRLQAYYSISLEFPESVLLKGPYKIKRGTPSSNETKSKKPKKPKGRKRKRRGGKGKKGRYRARIRKRNRRSGRSSEASDWSDPVDISQAEADKGIGFGVDTGQTGSFDVEAEKDGKVFRMADEKRGRRHSKRPHRRNKRRRHRGGKGGKSSHVTDGRTTNEGGNLSSTAADTGQNVEDAVDDPTAALDSVLPEGQVIISPGTYRVAISYWVRGEETQVSEEARITITSGQTIRVHFPDFNNLLIDAQFRDFDNGGNPDAWTLTGVGATLGTSVISEQGVWTLDTVGAKTGSTQTPVVSQTVTVSRDEFYAVGGTVSAGLAAGSFGAHLEELSSSGSVLRTTTLASLASSGSNVEFLRVMGAGYNEFHPDTEKVRMLLQFSGSTRNGVGYIHELFINPHSTVRIRRVSEPTEEREFLDADPPEYVRWNKASITGVGLPPSKATLLPDYAPLAAMDFETTDLAGWTLAQSSGSGITAIRETGAAINGLYGYRMQKDTVSNVTTYLTKDLGVSTTRTATAHNFKVRIVRVPNKGMIWLGAIGHLSGAGGKEDIIAGVTLTSGGRLWAANRDASAGEPLFLNQHEIASGIRNGDVLDIEIRVLRANSPKGTVEVYLGKNGGTRSRVYVTADWDWNGIFPRYAISGVFSYATDGSGLTKDTSSLWTLHYDSMVVTETGNLGSFVADVPEGSPFPQVDRPFLSSPQIDAPTFDTGSLPSAWSASRTPTDSTTAVAVETAAKIDGTHGVRCTDTGTASVASAYITRSFSPTRTRVGYRARIRVVSLPGTGTIDLLQVVSSGGQILGHVRLDNVGNLYARTLTAAGAQHKQTRISTGVTANTTLTIEMILSGVGTNAGFFHCWLAKGGTGATTERSMYATHSIIPWNALNISSVRAGLCAESSALATTTLHVDSIVLTEAGERVYREQDDLGNPIYQVYMYYPQGTPQQDDNGLKGLELAVQPNETYTIALRARHTDIPPDTPAFPYTFYAWDQSGAKHELGCLYGAGGATGTIPWSDLSETWTIPDDCYVVTMDSPGISSGEFVAQELAISRGTEATREVIYAQTGQVWVILDTETPKKFAFSPDNPIENRWLDIGAVVDEPEGTSATVQYNSDAPVYDAAGVLIHTGTEQPTSWLSNPLSVIPRKYAHILLSLNASSDLRTSPTLATETPYVDFYSNLYGQQVNVLLREDLSEFDGGVYLTDLPFYRELSQFDIREPLGQVRRHRMWDPIGDLGGFTIRAFTLDAVRDIEENCLSLDFAIETRDYRLMVRFREQIEFTVENTSVRKIQGVWCCDATASVSGVEVYEKLAINALVDSWAAP